MGNEGEKIGTHKLKERVIYKIDKYIEIECVVVHLSQFRNTVQRVQNKIKMKMTLS